MIEVKKRHDAAFPTSIRFNGGLVQRLTLKAAKELRNKLSDVIEWATNMDDLRRENFRKDQP